MNYLIVLQNQLQGMARAAVATLPSVVIGILVLMAAWLFARATAGIVRRITGHTHLRSDLRELLESLVKVAVWVIGFLLAATIVVPGFTFGGMIAGLGIGAVAIGFAFQDIFKNFLAGVLIMLREKMHIGDTIECEQITGTVEHITLRETHVRAPSGELTIVPNSMLAEKPVHIVTDQTVRRGEATVAVGFGKDVELVRTTLERAVRSVDAVAGDRPVEVLVQDIDGSGGALVIVLRWWTDAKANAMGEVRSRVLAAVAEACAADDVSLPAAAAEPVAREVKDAA